MPLSPNPSLPRVFLLLLMAGSLLAPVFGKQPTKEEAKSATQAKAHNEKPVLMKPFEVSETPPKLCFGVSLSVWTDTITKATTAIYITNVKPDSDAEKAGLGIYTRIIAIDGKPVEEMKPSFRDGTFLNRTFVNRGVGDTLTLTVIPSGATAPVDVHLVNRSKRYTKIDFIGGW